MVATVKNVFILIGIQNKSKGDIFVSILMRRVSAPKAQKFLTLRASR